MSNPTNRRNETRLMEKTTIFVEVYSASGDDSTPANIIVCSSLDLSANGIQLEMDQSVPIGSILRLCAELHNGSQALYLIGEAKWIAQSSDYCRIGFELYDAENSDIDGWREVVAAMIGNDNTD